MPIEEDYTNLKRPNEKSIGPSVYSCSKGEGEIEKVVDEVEEAINKIGIPPRYFSFNKISRRHKDEEIRL